MPLPGKKFALTPKWQPFLKFCSFQDSPNLNTYPETTRWDGKNDVSFMKLSQKLTEQRRCEVMLICSYIRHWCSKPHFLDSSLSSSGYISKTNDLRATKICQGMEYDMSTWDVDVEIKKNQGHGVCLYDRFLNGCTSVNFYARVSKQKPKCLPNYEWST